MAAAMTAKTAQKNSRLDASRPAASPSSRPPAKYTATAKSKNPIICFSTADHGPLRGPISPDWETR